jgi:hypothetical protein
LQRVDQHRGGALVLGARAGGVGGLPGTMGDRVRIRFVPGVIDG